jgi:hypothetical protein
MSEPLYSEHTCKSCENVFEGLYCNLCGEKVIEAKDRNLKTFLSNVVIATSIIDNRFVNSLKLAVVNPGFVSREYVDGRRVNYMRPLQMFFILNLVYFLFPVLQMFNSSLYTQMNVLPHSGLARTVVNAKLKAEQMDLLGFELMYNDKTTSLAKLLVVLFVLLASVPLSLIFRKKDRFFTDHVAFAVELTSFNLAVNAIMLSLVMMFASKIFHYGNTGWEMYLNDVTLTVIFISTNLYFIFRAAKTFYHQKGKRLIFKAALGIVGVFLALEAYRFLLFFITIMVL